MAVITSIGTATCAINSATAALSISGVTAAIGDFLAVGVAEINHSTGIAGGSIADSAGNTWTRQVNLAWFTGSGLMRVYTSPITNPLSAGTITYTLTDNRSSVAMSAIKCASVPGLSVVDLKNSNAGSSTSPSVTSGVPAVANEVFVAFATNDPTNASVWTADGTWNALNSVNTTATTAGIISGYLVNAGVGTKTFNPTTNNTNAWAVGLISIRPVFAASSQAVIIG